MKMKIVAGLVTCLLVVATVLGCAHTYEQNHMAESRDLNCQILVAVMPFQGVSESPGSGFIVADILANELYALNRYMVVTPEVVAARAAPREGETLSPEETGKLIGTPYILTGRVTEYTYKSGVGEQPAVGITARLLETDSGRVLWSATRAQTGSAAWFQEDSLGLLTSRLCRELALSLDGKARQYGWGKAEDEYAAWMFPVATAQNENPNLEDKKVVQETPAPQTAPAATVDE